jgi:hypothetical protein
MDRYGGPFRVIVLDGNDAEIERKTGDSRVIATVGVTALVPVEAKELPEWNLCRMEVSLSGVAFDIKRIRSKHGRQRQNEVDLARLMIVVRVAVESDHISRVILTLSKCSVVGQVDAEGRIDLYGMRSIRVQRQHNLPNKPVVECNQLGVVWRGIIRAMEPGLGVLVKGDLLLYRRAKLVRGLKIVDAKDALDNRLEVVDLAVVRDKVFWEHCLQGTIITD